MTTPTRNFKFATKADPPQTSAHTREALRRALGPTPYKKKANPKVAHSK
jgi:hypothetical protein